jgi:hypothetical protein
MTRNPWLPPIIGLCANGPQSGKTTAAEYLQTNHGYVNVPSRVLLDRIMKEFGVQEIALHDVVLKEKPHTLLGGMSTRRARQELGEFFRTHPQFADAWQMWWGRIARDVCDGGMGVVNDSIRYQREIDDIRDMGGVVLKIVRNTPQATSAAYLHPAEQRTLNADYVIINDGSYQSLYDKVESVLATHYTQAL